jgi:hypothetical protein
MADAPRTLDELRKINDPEEAVRYALAYIEGAKKKIADALVERDKALGQLADKHGPTKTAAMFNVSLSTVKNAHRTYKATKRK